VGHDLGRAILFVILPVAAAVLGSVVAGLHAPGPRLTSGVQHFAAGAVFAAAAGEVLPDLRRGGHLPAVIVGFVLGVAVLLWLQ